MIIFHLMSSWQEVIHLGSNLVFFVTGTHHGLCLLLSDLQNRPQDITDFLWNWSFLVNLSFLSPGDLNFDWTKNDLCSSFRTHPVPLVALAPLVAGTHGSWDMEDCPSIHCSVSILVQFYFLVWRVKLLDSKEWNVVHRNKI